MGSAQVKPSKSSDIVTFAKDNHCDIKTCTDKDATGAYDAVTSKPDESGQQKVVGAAIDQSATEGSSTKDKGVTSADDRSTTDGTSEQDKGNTADDQSTTEIEDTEDEEDETEQETLTPEEIEAYQNDILSEIKEFINEAHSKDSYTNEDGKYITEVRAVVERLYSRHSEMENIKKVPRAMLNKLENTVAKVATEPKTLNMICEIVITTYPERWLDKDGNIDDLLTFTLLTLGNYSDSSNDLAIALAHYPGFCEKIKEILQDRLKEYINQSQSINNIDEMIESCMTLTHNLSMRESNIGRMREIDFLDLLASYLASPNDDVRLLTFATLAAIINEKESEIIKANMELVEFLLTVLSNGSNERLRRYNGWSCKECTLIIRTLARNDANKKLLVELGALELLVKMGKIGDHDEQYVIRTLARNDANKKLLVELGALELLVKMGKIGDHDEQYAEAASSDHTPSRGGKSRESGGHVMISYQWADQETLIKIRDQLKSAGIQVWMDIDQMGGSTVESMARAVEQATVVLMCMSQKYKFSQNCRAEAEYAFQKQKTIVPLKMEQGYTPDGWLGFICGAKVFFEFSGKYKFEDKISHLLKELAAILQKTEKRGEDIVIPVQAPPVRAVIRYADEVDSGPQLASGVPVTMATSANPNFTKTIKTVREWSSEDVKKWVEKNNLKPCGADRLTGSEVALLMRMNKEAPECFFSCLQDPKKMKQLLNMSKMAWALEDLTDGQ